DPLPAHDHDPIRPAKIDRPLAAAPAQVAEQTHTESMPKQAPASAEPRTGRSPFMRCSFPTEAVFAMLACARLGAIHSVVFGGFAARELAVRIDDARPKIVLAASCGIEVNRVVEYKPLLNRALEEAVHA